MKSVLLDCLPLSHAPLVGVRWEGDEMLAKYFELKTVEIEDSFLGKLEQGDWNERKDEYRRLVICSGFLPTVLLRSQGYDYGQARGR